MLKTIHKYQKSVISVILMVAVCAAMLGFGMNTFSDRSESYAIKINEEIVSFGDFSRQRKAREDMYLQRFGDFYYKLKETQGWNIEQQVIDEIIPSMLLGKLAENLGLYVGTQELKKSISSKFPNGFDKSIYLGYLTQMNLTVSQFEKKAEEEALLAQLRSIISDFSTASKKEAVSLIERDKTVYLADYVELSPEEYLKEAKEPSSEELTEYYEENAVDYEEEPKVSYDFLVFTPADQFDDIEVFVDDIEIYYADHQEDFVTPAKAKISHIQFDFPPAATDEQKSELRKTAEEIRQEALSGTDFGGLALQHSSDILTKTLGGNLGWLIPDQHHKAIETAALSLNNTGIAELAVTDTAYHVIKVDQYEPKTPQPLEDVQQEITQKIKELEAPGYASVKAHETLEHWINSGKSLRKFAEQKKLQIEISEEPLKKNIDPSPSMKGLTNKVFNFPEETKRVIELNDTTVLVDLTDYHETQILALDSVKEKVIKNYKEKEAKILAKKAAESIISGFDEDRYQSLKTAAEEMELALKQSKELSRSEALPGVFSNSEISKVLFSTYKSGQKPERFFEQGDKLIIFQVTEIKQPVKEEIEKDLDQYIKRAAEENTQILVSSLVNRLKAKSEISIDPGLLVER